MKKNLSLEKIKEERKKSRIDKISSLIKKSIAEVFLTQDLHDSNGKRMFISVSHVFLSGDGKTATVYIDILNKSRQDEDDQIYKIIEENSVKIKREFSSKIELRYTPRLRFEILKKDNDK